HRRARIDRRVQHFTQVIDIAARRVFGRKLDIVGVAARLSHGGSRHLDDFGARLSELVLEMDVRGCAERVNAWTSRKLQGLGSTSDVLFGGAAERGDFDFLALGGNGFDGGEVTIRCDGKAGFDDVDAEVLELVSHPDLLRQVHRAAGRLFAIAQSGIEDADSVCWHGVPSCGQASEDATEPWAKSQSYNLYRNIKIIFDGLEFKLLACVFRRSSLKAEL